MKKLIFTLIFSFTYLFSSTVSLDGEWKYFVQHKNQPINYIYKFKGDEKTMPIPANWYKNGLNFSGVVWFEKEFEVNENFSHAKINFQGVDYISDVWLNGEYLGNHEGYFAPFFFDISKKLKKKNKLLVRVNSPAEVQEQNFSLRKTLLKGVFSHHDTRAGGAWSKKGQDKNSGGIWGEVTLSLENNTWFEDLNINYKMQNTKALVDINFSLNGKYLNKKAKIFIKPLNFKGPTQYLEKIIKKKNESAKLIFNPKLWMPYGYGKAHMYEVLVKVDNKTISKKVGFRKITYDKKEQLYINGVKIFIRGTNYISDHYLSKMTRDKYKKDIVAMQEANINTIRVHVHVEKKEFYELADEMGMLIWQDYNLQWGYIEDEEFNKEAKKQLIEMINLLRSHPSIYIYCMHNEPPWDAPWMKWKYSDYKHKDKQNLILDEMLFETAKKHETKRAIKMVSQTQEHPWFGWYFGSYKLFREKSKKALVTEYGSQALPNLESLKKIIPEKNLFPKTDKDYKVWSYKNFQKRETFEIAKIKKGKNINEFINNTQTYQSNLIKFAVEMLRIQKEKPVTAVFQFLFNEPYASINWGVIDYFRVPKKAYFTLKDVYRPLLPILRIEEQIYVDGFIVNDSLKDYRNTNFKYYLYDKNKKLINTYEFKLDIPKQSAYKLFDLNMKQKVYSARVELTTEDGVITNSYSQNYLEELNGR